MLTRPELEILADTGPIDPRFVPVVTALAWWCAPTSTPRERPVVRLASSPRARGLDSALADPTVPVAIWVGSGSVDRAVANRAAALLVDVGRGDVHRSDAVVEVPAPGVDAATHLPLPPFVRRRWRHRARLPEETVVTIGAAPPENHLPLAEDLVPTALALASSAVVRGPWILTALALGTAVVTDAATAASVGAVGDTHVVVAPADDAHGAARELARDDAVAATFGRRARRLVEERHDLGRVAARLASSLGLDDFGAAPHRRVRLALLELGTTHDSRVARRLLGAYRTPDDGGLP